MTCLRLRMAICLALVLAASPALAAQNWPRSCDWRDPVSCFGTFHDGRALVPTGSVESLDKAPVYGYIDYDGQMAIAPRFEKAAPFANGLAQVKLDGKWGYIDTSGAFVISPHYDSANSFNAAGVAVVEEGEEFSLIDRTGAVVKRFPLGARYLEPGNQSELSLTPIEVPVVPKVWNAASETVLTLPDKTMRVEPAPSVEGGLFVLIRDSRYRGQWGLLDADGAWIVAPETLHTRYLPKTDGEAFALKRDDGWQLVDRQGQALTQPVFRTISLVAPGIWYVRQQDRTKLLLGNDGNTLVSLGKRPRQINRDELPTYFQIDEGVVIINAAGEVVTKTFADFDSGRVKGDYLWIYDKESQPVEPFSPDGTAVLDDETTARLEDYYVTPLPATAANEATLPLAELRPKDVNAAPAILSREARS